jgi:hypothetical protein
VSVSVSVSVSVFVLCGVCCVVWALALFSLLNIMKRSSPAFSRKKKLVALLPLFLLPNY